MYIGYSKTSNLLSYYCQRCNVKGLVNATLLNMYDLFSMDLKARVNEHIKTFMNSNSLYKNKNTIRKYVNYDFSLNGLYYRDFYYKLDYLDSRFGYGFSNIETLSKYRIILSIKDFLISNNVNKNFKMELIDDLESNYVGFLCYSGCNIIFRHINPTSRDRRYFKMTLESDLVQSEFYSIRNSVDTSKKFSINITEGTFDIIRLDYENLLDKNSINVSVLNKDYINKIKYLLTITGSLNNLKSINIYSDSDVSYRFYKNQFKSIEPIFESKIKIFKNSCGKDYGDIADNVVLERIYELKRIIN